MSAYRTVLRSSAISGRTEFRGDSTAATATIHNRGFVTPGGVAGRTDFFDDSTAGLASIQLYEGYTDSGRVEFHDRAKAGFANIAVNNVPAIVGSTGSLSGHVIRLGVVVGIELPRTLTCDISFCFPAA